MSMSREKIAQHIERENFAVFNEVAKEQYVTVANDIVDCFCKEFLQSAHPERWIEFMRHLYTQPPGFVRSPNMYATTGAFLKMPDYMISVLKFVLVSDKRAPNNDQRCAQLLMMILSELEQTPAFNLNGNKLRSIKKHLLNDKNAHMAMLNLIDRMDDSEKKKAYGYLVDRYIVSPRTLCEIYLFGNRTNIFDDLLSATNDKDKQWYLETMKNMIQSAKDIESEDDVWEVCSYLAGITTDLSFAPSNEEMKIYLRLKKISTESGLVLDKAQELIRDDAGAMAKLDELRKGGDEEILDFTKQMKKLVDGFGRLSYKEGLLNAAQTADRKQYDYNPVILKEGELSDFLETISTIKAKAPTRIRFIQTGNHWIAGDIEIDMDGFARVALFDSLGGYTPSGLYHATLGAVEMISKYLPNSEVYIGKEKRQNSSSGCSVFSQDDAAHLFNLETHLKMNLFDYLAKQNNPAIQVGRGDSSPVTYYSCHLPLSLLRTAQTRKYLNAVKEGKHPLPDSVVNKKTQLFTESSGRFFEPKPRNQPGEQNTRLEYALRKMAKQIAIYRITHDKDTIAKEVQKFTLSNFKKRVELTAVVNNTLDDGNTPLHRSIRDGDSVDALSWLCAGSDPYSKNSRGRTAMDIAIHATPLDKDLASYLLMKAVQANDQLIVERLLQRGADPNDKRVRKLFGEYPLHLAVRKENNALVEPLLKHDARIDLEDKNGNYPVEMAFDHYNLPLIMLLLQDGKNVSADDVNGSVFEAVENDYWSEVVPFLMSAHADTQLDPKSKRILETNVQPIYDELISQLGEVRDKVERGRLLKMAANPEKLLGTLIANNPAVDILMYIAILHSEFDSVLEKDSSQNFQPQPKF